MSSAQSLGLRPADLARDRPYEERDEREASWLDDLALALWYGWLHPPWRALQAGRQSGRAFVRRVRLLEAGLSNLGHEAICRRAQALRPRLRSHGLAGPSVAEAFALIGEAASRVLGKRPFASQLIAGSLLLRGTLVEMATGEGKTFAATLPAITAALAGLPVHVITVNDYLAARDAEIMAPLYRFFGLRVGSVVQGMPREQRRAVYAGHVTYVSNKELAFDYLRDRSALGNRASPLHLAVERLRDSAKAATVDCVLRGLAFAIVDEADSVFIDEARTPLILSATVDGMDSPVACQWALRVAQTLEPGVDYQVQLAQRRIVLNEAGRECLTRLHGEAEAAGQAEYDSLREFSLAVQQALTAQHLYQWDEHYVVVDGKVQIVDESTGRSMPDRAWEQGLHQMIEAKEGLALTGRRETLARITYQRLFRRYLRLAGMSGTASEVAREITATYRLPVVRVPLHRPSKRVMYPARCLPNREAKWQAVSDAVHRHAVEQGRPVLIGTRTVRDSEELAARLQQRGIAHVVLNARQDRSEADIIAAAGLAARVTVATNMAGRGTDVLLGPGVAERGGLHVILTEYHDSPRVDRQLFGRAGRQGDPGSGQAIVSLDDGLFVSQVPQLVAWHRRRGKELGPLALTVLRTLSQWIAERHHRDVREASLRQDRRLAKLLAFSGRGE